MHRLGAKVGPRLVLRAPSSLWWPEIYFLIIHILGSHSPALRPPSPRLLMGDPNPPTAASAARCAVFTSSWDLQQRLPSSETFPFFSLFIPLSVPHCPCKAESPKTDTDLDLEGDSSGPNIYRMLGLVRRTRLPHLSSPHITFMFIYNNFYLRFKAFCLIFHILLYWGTSLKRYSLHYIFFENRMIAFLYNM